MRIIIVGGSKTVYYLAREFMRQDFHVTIINRNADRARELAEKTKATVIHGEGTDLDIIEEAGARQADVVIGLTSHDEDNLVICQIAQKQFSVPRTIAMVNDPDNEAVFQKLGITIAFSATRILGSIIAQEAVFEEVTSLLPLARGKLNITEVRLDADAPAVGKNLIDLELSEETLIACIIRNEQVTVPRGSSVLEVDDHLILISESGKLTHDLEMLVGHTP
ncbi:MAG: potassium channel family protein [Anaerolineae bacterium]